MRRKNIHKLLVSPQELIFEIQIAPTNIQTHFKKNKRDTNKVHYGREVMYSPAELMGQKRHINIAKASI